MTTPLQVIRGALGFVETWRALPAEMRWGRPSAGVIRRFRIPSHTSLGYKSLLETGMIDPRFDQAKDGRDAGDATVA